MRKEDAERLSRLKKANALPIYSCASSAFRTYGRLQDGDFSELIKTLERVTEIPREGNVYVPSVPALEELPIKETLEKEHYGEMEIEIGYCVGRGVSFNGLEYHKGSEIDVFASPVLLALAHVWEIEGNAIGTEAIKLFYFPAGSAVELYATTLHLAPIRTEEGGFRAAIVLPKGTNTELSAAKGARVSEEGELLFKRNKWMLAHPERAVLINAGAHAGLIGENKEIKLG